MSMRNSVNCARQSGVALPISLIILLVLTLVVVSGSQDVVLQEKMSAAVRDGHVSLQVAEYALYKASQDVETLTGTGGFSDTGTGGYYSKDNGPADVFDSSIWTDAKTKKGTVSVSGKNLTYRYFIEEAGLIDVDDDHGDINMVGYGQTSGGGDVTAFRVVARGTGISGNAERVVVAYVGKRL